MKTRLTSSAMLIIAATALAACDIKSAVPEFEYPVYKPDKKWPELVPTEDLVNATDVDIEATIEDVERLKKLAN
ncbi:MAG: hypothetical protein IME92_10000 [Proteobacteria bacterium]|nr:hypothetical protein [Pseudomonadota bacterium]